jgi:dienelactone hydrolase
MSQGNYDPRFGPNPFAPQGGPGFGSQPPGNQAPWQQNAFNPQPYQQPPKSSAGKTLLIIFGTLGGGFALLLLVCCGSIMWLGKTPQVSAAAKQPFNLAAVPMPAFPERGQPTDFGGVDLYKVKINGQTGGHYTPPGHGGSIFVYLPKGSHPAKSLPCVLITGAGTDLMSGVEFEDIVEEEEAAEHLPYVRAGMAVVVYEMDGSGYNGDEDEDDGDVQMYKDFRAACAGMVNARNALEFTLQKCPEVNPSQIFTAGHSSAGTSALLFAAHEPRIAGAIGYAPCSDVENFQPRALIRALSFSFPQLHDFLCQSSPKTHAQRITCPVFLFHAEDDDTVKIKTTHDFAALLQPHNQNVTVETVPGGDHYFSMIEQGIPKGVAWLKQRTGK